MYEDVIAFIRDLYGNQEFVSLHAPVFLGNEKKYLNDCIDSTYVSYVGKYVSMLEKMTSDYTGARYSVAVVNGTSALQIALLVAGLERGEEVITQPLTFVATSNAIHHAGGIPVYVDVERETLGMSPAKLSEFLEANYVLRDEKCFNIRTGRRLKIIVPVHIFGFPCKVDEIVGVAERYNLQVVEDAAESLGSFYRGKHTGTFGQAGIISYNGNKIITTGGGGMIITDDALLAEKARHITTTAKVPHKWEYIHDTQAFNYRMTNLSAAVGCAQMEKLEAFVENKRTTAQLYSDYFKKKQIPFFEEPSGSRSNCWLNTILFDNRAQRDEFLEISNQNGVMTRPAWRMMNKLDMYRDCLKGDLQNAEWLEDRLVNLPSGYRE